MFLIMLYLLTIESSVVNMVIDKMIEICSNLAFHLLQDVRDNLIGPYLLVLLIIKLDQ